MIDKRAALQKMPFFDLAARGYRMPAEWEPHRGTWLSYPHNPKSFFTRLAGAQEAWADMVMHLARVEEVHVNVNDDSMAAALKRKLAARKVRRHVILHHWPTNDAWCRDHGAIMLKQRQSGKLVATDWIFNAWGGKYPAGRDNRIARKMAAFLGVECFSFPVVLEGGSIEVNGCGAMLTTRACLLNRNRNPQYSQADIEKLLKAVLGMQQILWLSEGIAGDDTDGHIDDLARFTDPRTIVAAREDDPRDANYAILKENLRALKAFRNMDGRPFRIVTLPMPAPRYYRQDERLPASYLNFYVANGLVLLPTFACPQDQEAVRVLGRLFPGRKIITIDATDIVVGRGTCHCLTQQIPL